jgi:predicted O-methyltransferase YrrM
VTTAPQSAAAAQASRSGRALIVAPSLEAASSFAGVFDQMRTVTPDEFGSTVAAGASAWECVAITGVSVLDGALARVLVAVRANLADEVLVLIDLSAPTGAELIDGGAGALRGFEVVDRTDVGGVSCLRLRPAADCDATPDATLLTQSLIGAPSAADQRPGEVESVTAQVHNEQLRRRVAELEADLASANKALAAATSPARPIGPSSAASGRRRKAQIAVAGVVLVAAIAVLLALVTDTGYDGALITALILLTIANLLYVWRGQRQQHGLIRRTATAGLKRQQKIAEATRQRDAALTKSIAALQTKITELQRNLKVVTASTVESARTVARLPGATNRASLPDLHQTQAIANLFSMLPVDEVVPLMGGWAASPDVVLLLVQEVCARKPRLIVECGSGVSTLWLALTIQKYGLDSRVVALDHDAHYASQTRESLTRHGVDHLAEVRYAPLRTIDLPDHETPWYDLGAIADLDGIGLLFVDGPPEATGPRVRYPAVPLLRDRLAPQATIVLDDLMRQSEQEITRAWDSTLDGFSLERLPLEKGASVFRRS